MIAAAVSIIFTSAEPALAQTKSEKWKSDIESIFQPRMAQLAEVKKFVQDPNNTIDEKILEITKLAFPDNEEFHMDSKTLSEFGLPEEVTNKLRQDILDSFIEYVDGIGLLFYQFLSEKLKAGLEITCRVPESHQRELLEAFESTADKSSPQLNWLRLAEVSKNKAIYRLLIEHWIPQIIKSRIAWNRHLDEENNEIDQKNRELDEENRERKLPSGKVRARWVSGSKKTGLDPRSLPVEIWINLAKYEQDNLVKLTVRLERWCENPENLIVVSPEDLEEIRFAKEGRKLSFAPECQVPPMMICRSVFGMPEYFHSPDHDEVQQRIKTYDVSRNPFLDNKFAAEQCADIQRFEKCYYGGMVKSIEEFNQSCDAFHKQLPNELKADLGEEWKRRLRPHEKLSAREMRVCIEIAAPGAIRELGNLIEKLSSEGELDSRKEHSLQDLRQRIENFKELLANYKKDDQTDVTEMLDRIANSSLLLCCQNSQSKILKTPFAFDAFSAANYIHDYTVSMMSLQLSLRTVFSAVLCGESKSICDQLNLCVEPFGFEEPQNGSEGPSTPPQIDPKNKPIRNFDVNALIRKMGFIRNY